VANRSARWPTVGGAPGGGGELRLAGANSGRRRRAPVGGGELRAAAANSGRPSPAGDRERGGRPAATGSGAGGRRRQGAGRAAGGEPGRRRAGRAVLVFAVGETRTEKKREQRSQRRNAQRRNGGGGYFLARRQDLWRRARCHAICHVTELGATGCGAEMCYLGATIYGAELRVQTCKLNFWGSKRKFLSRKGLKNKKFGQRPQVHTAVRNLLGLNREEKLVREDLTANTRDQRANPQKNLNHFSICACHPCAGVMLIFSVSFQFYRMSPKRRWGVSGQVYNFNFGSVTGRGGTNYLLA
jgi:hypothetical protein